MNFNIFLKVAKKIEKASEEKTLQSKDIKKEQPIDRKSIPANVIDDAQRIEASPKYRKKVYKALYTDYPEMPFISKDREKYTNWLDEAIEWYKTTGKIRGIQKEMMTRYPDGLLPGHVYMLYWLKKYTMKRRIPVYFEYKYGVDFIKEKAFLFENGYINEQDKPTEKGENAIKIHADVIEQHTPPKPDTSIEGITKQILKQRDNMLKNGAEEYEFLANSGCCNVCKRLDGKHFKIKDMEPGVNAPPMHERCRCAVVEYEDMEEYEAWLDYLDKGGTTAEWERHGKAEWSKSKSKRKKKNP